MIRILIKVFKVISLFMLFWFLNNGFLMTPSWQPIQAIFFTAVTVIIFKYTKIKLKYWFCLIGLLYIISAVLEVLKVHIFSDVMASTGFGILIIVVLVGSLRRYI